MLRFLVEVEVEVEQWKFKNPMFDFDFQSLPKCQGKVPGESARIKF